MRKVLFIAPMPTHPTNAGNRARLLALAIALQRTGNEVHFAFVRMDTGDEAAMRAFWGRGYHPIPYTRPLIRRNFVERVGEWIVGRVDLTRKFVFRIDDLFDDSALDALRSLDRELGFDVVVTAYIYMSRSFQAFGSNVFKVLDTHDIFTDRHKIYLANGVRPEWFSTTRPQEALALSRANAVMAIQEKERAFFASLTAREVITVGHLVRVDPLWRQDAAHKDLLFVGSANRINVDSLDVFMAKTFPLIRSALPTARVLVAGKVCDRLEGRADVVLIGALPDIADAYRQAGVVINPVTYGTGLNVKTVEALGFGMPLVATSVGAKGISADDSSFLVANTPEEFASASVRLLTDAALAATLSRNALDFANRWNSLHTAALCGLIESAAPRHRL